MQVNQYIAVYNQPPIHNVILGIPKNSSNVCRHFARREIEMDARKRKKKDNKVQIYILF